MAGGVPAAGNSPVKIDYSARPNGDLDTPIVLNGKTVYVNARNAAYAKEHPDALLPFTGDIAGAMGRLVWSPNR